MQHNVATNQCQYMSIYSIRLNRLSNDIPELLDGVLVPRESVALCVVEHVSGVWVADVVESQGPMNIGVERADCDSISKQERGMPQRRKTY